MKTLKENKFSIIFFITYLVYPSILIFNLIYHLGDHGAALLAILMVIYEIIYVFRLGRKEGVSLNRAVANGFLYLFFMPNIFWIWHYTDIFFNGYFERAFLRGELLHEYYGFEAWRNDIISAILFTVTFIPFVIYTIFYFVINKYLKNKNTQNNVHGS